jgi:hypothetical protein
MSLWKCIKRFFVYHQCSDPDTAFEKRLELFREAERQNMLVEEVIEEVKEEAEDRKLNRNIKKMEEIGFIIDAKTDNVRKELADTREKLFLTVNSYHNNTAREMNQAKESFDNIIRGMNNRLERLERNPVPVPEIVKRKPGRPKNVKI